MTLPGEDTSSNTTAWTLYLVSQHPEVEAKLVAELEQAGLLATPQQPEPRALQYADLSKLTFLSMVIKARASHPCVVHIMYVHQYT